ncbi:MAG: uroporphyrinogen-III synthase [Bradyrhizobiaceae bacterium]|nr:uroporphyrinogen-III synthase [Bradyrhizobiaceae bacterium]
MRILVTRPQPGAARTAARLAELGHEAVIDSLLSIEPLAVSRIPAGPFAALTATSANAVRIAGAMVELERFRRLPLYAVGSATAEAARASGFVDVVAADGDAGSLAQKLAGELARGARVLHLAGEERARDLGELLAPAGIAVDLLVLYRMRAATAFGAAAELLASGKLDAALHFSPRSAATFTALAKQAGLVKVACTVRHLCLSAAVAEPLAALGARVEVAARPNEAALLSLLKS